MFARRKIIDGKTRQTEITHSVKAKELVRSKTSKVARLKPPSSLNVQEYDLPAAAKARTARLRRTWASGRRSFAGKRASTKKEEKRKRISRTKKKRLRETSEGSRTKPSFKLEGKIAFDEEHSPTNSVGLPHKQGKFQAGAVASLAEDKRPARPSPSRSRGVPNQPGVHRLRRNGHQGLQEKKKKKAMTVLN